MRGWVLVLGLSLGGCISVGTKVDTTTVSQFQCGVTTYEEVVARLGPPNSTTRSGDGRTTIVYSWAHSQARAETFIPIIGPLVGGADAVGSTVILMFDPGGKLETITTSNSEF